MKSVSIISEKLIQIIAISVSSIHEINLHLLNLLSICMLMMLEKEKQDDSLNNIDMFVDEKEESEVKISL